MALRERGGGGGLTYIQGMKGEFSHLPKKKTQHARFSTKREEKKFLKLFPVGFRTELDIRGSPHCKLNASEK